MFTVKNFGFGFFFTKQDLDCDSPKRRDIGFRVFWKPNHFVDVHLFPRPHVYTCRWGQQR